MSGHAIVNGRPTCLEPDTAECRVHYDRSECDCECYDSHEQLPDGRWRHLAYDADGEEAWHVSIGARTADACNICLWLDEGVEDTGPDEVQGWLAYFDFLPDGPIETWWDDFYAWSYTDPRVTGRAIGRLAVARWADDLGLEWAA